MKLAMIKIFERIESFIFNITKQLNRGRKMKKITKLMFVILFSLLFIIPSSVFSQWLYKPTVDLPSNWFLEIEADYGEYQGWWDTEGAGLLKYKNEEEDGTIYIYYERALNDTYTNNELTGQAITFWMTNHEEDIDDYGVMTCAGVPAGFMYYQYPEGVNYRGIVVAKGNYLFDINTIWDTSRAEGEITSILNSLDVNTAGGTNIPTEIVLGVIIVVVILIILLFFFKKRKTTPLESLIEP